MPKQRDKVKMSEAEVAAFLDEVKSLNVATLDQHGAPHLTTLWFCQHGGDILFETYGTSQKVVNLRRDPRIAVLCEAGLEYDDLRGVSIKGRAEIVDQEPRLSALMETIGQHIHPEFSDEQRAAWLAKMIRRRVVVIVHPERTMSWDHRKIAAG